MADDYRLRIATALVTRNPVGLLVDALMAVRDDELRRAETVIDDLATLVRDLADPGPCEDFDHHGHCQTHGWLQDGICPHARARDILTAQDAGENRG